MIEKPTFIEPVPFQDGRAWRGGGEFLYEEKIDGKFATFQDVKNSALIAGEETKAAFFAFDCLEYGGEDIRRWPLRERLRVLDSICPRGHCVAATMCRPRVGQGGEFLEAIVAGGGEGIVVKPWSAPWGATWWKCKREENYLCHVVELDPWRGAARVQVQRLKAEGQSLPEDGGWIALRSRFDRVRVGSVLKVVAFGRHKSGKLREARLDRDTETSWLVTW